VRHRQEVKCLLLGSGESGKSTILKQLRLLSDGAHTDEERFAYRELIFANAVQSMQVVVDAMDDLGLTLPSEVQPHAALFSSLDIQPDVMDHNGDMYEDVSGVLCRCAGKEGAELTSFGVASFATVSSLCGSLTRPGNASASRTPSS